MRSNKKQNALVSVLLNGEPFIFVLCMFLGLLGSSSLSEQTGQVIPLWLSAGLSILLSSAVMALLYPKPVWWLAFIRYFVTGVLTGFLVNLIVNDLLKPNSFLNQLVNSGLTQIWTITEGVNFPEVIIIGMIACFISIFWIGIVCIFFTFILMLIVVMLFGISNTLLLIWFKPIFDSFEAEQSEKAAPIQQQNGKNKWVALVFCLIGMFTFIHGLHRFYTGRYITGILQLLTLGGLYLWAISDLILILSGNFVTNKTEVLEEVEVIDNEAVR